MKEIRIVPLKKKVIWFTVCFCVLHIYLAYSSFAIIGVAYFDTPDQITIDGADFTGLAILQADFLNSIFFCINVFAYILVNAILLAVYMVIFSRLFYSTAPDDGKRFKKYANYIMLALMLTGFLVPNVLAYETFPLSLIPTILDYLIFSFLAYIITMHKIKKTYL